MLTAHQQARPATRPAAPSRCRVRPAPAQALPPITGWERFPVPIKIDDGGGNHRSHCAASPASQTSRSAGSGRRCSGRSRLTFSRNQVIDPDQSTRSAITVAGISGNSASSARTLLSNGENDVGAGLRSYLGGTSDATAFTTVVREIPRRDAIRAFGTPSAASLRINAQPSKVITLQSLSVHFPSVATVQFSSVVDNRHRSRSAPACSSLYADRRIDHVGRDPDQTSAGRRQRPVSSGAADDPMVTVAVRMAPLARGGTSFDPSVAPASICS